MSETIFNMFKINMLHSFKFKYPKYTIINNIKINNLNIFSKVLSKGRISIYGDYEIIITYNNKISYKSVSKNLTKHKTSSFYKVFHCRDIAKYGSPKNLKSTMKFLSTPKCLYSTQNYLRPYYFLKDKNICKILLFYPLSINICTKKTPNNNTNNNIKNIDDTIVNEDLIYKDTLPFTPSLENLNNSTLSKSEYINSNSSYEDKNNNKFNLNLDYTDLPITILEKSNTINNTINEHSQSNKQNNDYKKNSNKPLPNFKNLKTSYNKTLPSITPFKKQFQSKSKKLIECNLILGRGFTNVFLQKDIILTPPTEPIWKITDVITNAEVTKLDLSGEKAFASGFAYIDINYKTLISSSSENTINGDLQYINLIIPFSTCINLISDSNDKIKKSDHCQVSNIYISETHKLKKPSTTSSKDIVYSELIEQFVIQITLLVTRSVEFHI